MNPRIAKSGGDILGQPVNKCSLRFLFSFFNFTIDNEKHNGSFIRMGVCVAGWVGEWWVGVVVGVGVGVGVVCGCGCGSVCVCLCV